MKWLILLVMAFLVNKYYIEPMGELQDTKKIIKDTKKRVLDSKEHSENFTKEQNQNKIKVKKENEKLHINIDTNFSNGAHTITI